FRAIRAARIERVGVGAGRVGAALVADRVRVAGRIRHRELADVRAVAAERVEAEVPGARALGEDGDRVAGALRDAGDRHAVGAALRDLPVVGTTAARGRRARDAGAVRPDDRDDAVAAGIRERRRGLHAGGRA